MTRVTDYFKWVETSHLQFFLAHMFHSLESLLLDMTIKTLRINDYNSVKTTSLMKSWGGISDVTNFQMLHIFLSKNLHLLLTKCQYLCFEMG